jgi:flagellar motor component MotA
MNDFVKEYNAIVERALLFVEKATSDGILALEDLIDEEKYIQRDIFEYGVTLVLDGIEPEIIDHILTNIIELEADKDKTLLKKIQKEAVLAISAGTNSRMVLMLLNSYVNIDVENTMKKYKELEEKESEKYTMEKFEKKKKKFEKSKEKLEEIESYLKKKNLGRFYD